MTCVRVSSCWQIDVKGAGVVPFSDAQPGDLLLVSAGAWRSGEQPRTSPDWTLVSNCSTGEWNFWVWQKICGSDREEFRWTIDNSVQELDVFAGVFRGEPAGMITGGPLSCWGSEQEQEEEVDEPQIIDVEMP